MVRSRIRLRTICVHTPEPHQAFPLEMTDSSDTL